MQTGSTGTSASGYPDDQYAERGWGCPRHRDFSLGKANPVQVVIEGAVTDPAVKDGIALSAGGAEE